MNKYIKQSISLIESILKSTNEKIQLQSIGMRDKRMVARFKWPDFTIEAIDEINKIHKNIIFIDLPKYDKGLSGKYLSSKLDLNLESEKQTIWITFVTNVKVSQNGTSGPGEDELVGLIEKIVKVKQRADFVIQDFEFNNITCALKPDKLKSNLGEPKIDVLLLSGDKAHESGAFSLKLATERGGAPTYGGWSFKNEFFKKEIIDLIENYINLLKPKQISNNFYENVGNFAMKTSDFVAQYSIYGDENICGGLQWGKKSVDHIIEVLDNPTIEDLGLNCFKINGLIIHQKLDLFRNTLMEPTWLIRGASDRKSGFDKIINKTRIAVVPYQRSKKYFFDF